MFSQRWSVDEFRRDVMRGIDLADFINRDYVWMIDCRNGPGFLLKPANAIFVTSQFRQQDFQRDLASELHILSQVDGAHSAGTQRRNDFVMTQLCSCGNFHNKFRLLNRSETLRAEQQRFFTLYLTI